ASGCLVMVAEGAVDTRRRLVKAAARAGVVQEFPRLRGRELEDWIKERGGALNLRWESGAVQLLAARAGDGLQKLEQELEKLAAYAGAGGRVGRAEIELLVPEARTARVFDLIDAALAGEEEKALQLLAQLLEQGETALGLTALLARQVRLLILVKDKMEQGVRPAALAATLKLHPFVAQKVAAQSRRFTWEGLYALIQSLAAADQKLKSSGLSPQLVLEQVLLSMAAKK
ncbi:MAG TPA: DNA polymerase III subunit delta, partial [Firmicutes bacterium]|nr:DNA polymerase III subunit delta [Bacillota bacterium]